MPEVRHVPQQTAKLKCRGFGGWPGKELGVNSMHQLNTLQCSEASECLAYGMCTHRHDNANAPSKAPAQADSQNLGRDVARAASQAPRPPRRSA